MQSYDLKFIKKIESKNVKVLRTKTWRIMLLSK